MEREWTKEQIELYCLGVLTEECGEAVDSLGKALRFGIDSPGVPGGVLSSARNFVEKEMGDIMAAIRFAISHGVLDEKRVINFAQAKIDKLTDPSRKDNLGRPLAPLPKEK